MYHYHLSRRLALILMSIGACYLWIITRRPSYKSTHSNQKHPQTNGLTWGIAQRLFVISLPRRIDRRDTLRPLLRAHHIHLPTSSTNQTDEACVYIPATDLTSPSITNILAHVRAQRRLEYTTFHHSKANALLNERGRRASFEDALAKSPNEEWGSDLWGEERLEDTVMDWDELLDPDADYALLAEKGNPFNLRKFTSMPTWTGLPSPRTTTMTRAMIACWYSHVQVIRKIALMSPEDQKMQDDVSLSMKRTEGPTYIVMEDDVDFEWAIEELLVPIWGALPSGWEIVILGHCWSDETRYPALFTTNATFIDNKEGNTKSITASLHPSNSPLCTHAYALSPYGARRLYNLLRHPAFAYSRPLDQALAWLIRSGWIKRAYSIVPSLVIQTKDGRSDISEKRGRGSRWRDRLVDSTRDRIRGSEERIAWLENWYPH